MSVIVEKVADAISDLESHRHLNAAEQPPPSESEASTSDEDTPTEGDSGLDDEYIVIRPDKTNDRNISASNKANTATEDSRRGPTRDHTEDFQAARDVAVRLRKYFSDNIKVTNTEDSKARLDVLSDAASAATNTATKDLIAELAATHRRKIFIAQWTNFLFQLLVSGSIITLLVYSQYQGTKWVVSKLTAPAVKVPDVPIVASPSWSYSDSRISKIVPKCDSHHLVCRLRNKVHEDAAKLANTMAKVHDDATKFANTMAKSQPAPVTVTVTVTSAPTSTSVPGLVSLPAHRSRGALTKLKETLWAWDVYIDEKLAPCHDLIIPVAITIGSLWYSIHSRKPATATNHPEPSFWPGTVADYVLAMAFGYIITLLGDTGVPASTQSTSPPQ